MPNPIFANRNQKTRPHKQIIITLYDEFVERSKVYKRGIYGRGITSNMTLFKYIAFIFEINEYLPKEHKLTDFQIARCLINEFPKLKIPQGIFGYITGKIEYKKLYSLTSYRNYYNLGKLLNQNNKRHGPISFAYNNDGIPVSYKGTPLTQEQIEQKLIKYGPDRRDTKEFDWDTIAMFTRTNKKKGRPTYESFDWCI